VGVDQGWQTKRLVGQWHLAGVTDRDETDEHLFQRNSSGTGLVFMEFSGRYMWRVFVWVVAVVCEVDSLPIHTILTEPHVEALIASINLSRSRASRPVEKQLYQLGRCFVRVLFYHLVDFELESCLDDAIFNLLDRKYFRRIFLLTLIKISTMEHMLDQLVLCSRLVHSR
jgi:hypothetical protein